MKIGNEDAKLYLGGSEVDKIYLGTEQVYGGSTATPKWIATYVGGTTSSAECDSTSAITENEITLANLTNVAIGDCVTSIDEYAFSNCDSLSSITIGSGVTTIGEGVFDGCFGLTSVTIGNSVTTIGFGAFGGCSSLSSVTIPSGVTSIGESAFLLCQNLTGITIYAATPPTLGMGAFDDTNDCPIYVPSSSLGAYQTNWSTYASRIRVLQFYGKWIATYVGGTTSSAECNSSSTITQGEITLANLTNVVIGDCVTSIGDYAFIEGHELSSIIIPDTVTSIGEWAFQGCSSLSSVTIGNSVTIIDEWAFQGCSSLSSVTCLSTTPPTLGMAAFDDTNDCPIYVPAASVDTYQTARGWRDYVSRIQAIQ